MKIQKITPFLWFDKEAADAGKFYTTVFRNSRIVHSNPVVTQVEIEGLNICLLNGGPIYKLTEAFSLSIACDTQEEIDYYWDAFTKNGGEESMCGWCKDKFGVSWQVVPAKLGEWMSDPERGPRVMQAFLKMKKFDIATLEKV